jgi:hypothetical protein
LNQVQLLALQAAWRSISDEDHHSAWVGVGVVGSLDGLTKEIHRVRNRALAWAARGSNAAPYRGNADYGWLQVKGEVGEAVADAAVAVALGSRLDEESRETLLAPWLRVTEGED